MNPLHAEVFKAAARLYDVYILVRRTNSASFDHIGHPRCVAKRLDCKAKTADRDYCHPAHGPKRTAGLVVDPTIVGEQAFRDGRKYLSALKEWRIFAANMIEQHVATLEGQRRLTYIPNQGFYFVDLDPGSERFGCVKFTQNSMLAAGKYIHGDFDLYGIVRADDPSRNVAVHESRLQNKHSRSPEFFDVQHFVNGRLGLPMVLHGAHEAYGTEHADEGIDVFHPDGSMTGARNAAEIAQLYATMFKGRRLFTQNGPRNFVRGLFSTPG